jgi:hypothetical protein
MAEGEGFEPPFPGRKAVFKTAALNHSAIPPCPLLFLFTTLYLLCQPQDKVSISLTNLQPNVTKII